MTKGARAAANRMKVSDADIRACLDSPEEAAPDRKPGCTRFRKGRLALVTGSDGTVLRVSRQRR